jgi:DNA-binding PadR family transcriptional regulator
VTPVFGHGRLRLYLLKLLDESPRHGYEVIRLLEDRFLGLYQPSAGTIYPRLARLEAEGLVIHAQQGGRKVYEITPAGRAELAARTGELAVLEGQIRESVHDLAEEVRAEVHGNAGGGRDELTQVAKQMRRDQNRPGQHVDWAAYSWPPSAPAAEKRPLGSTPVARDLERWVDSFADHARDLARQSSPSQEQLTRSGAILDDALARLREILNAG